MNNLDYRIRLLSSTYDIKYSSLVKIHKTYSSKLLIRETKKLFGDDYNPNLVNSLFISDSEPFLYPENLALDVIERYFRIKYR